MLKSKINFNRIRKLVIDGNIKKLRLEAGNIEVGIVKRTQKGLDVNFKSFKPYSTAYGKKKEIKIVNLTVEFDMLGAITHRDITNGVQFYFNAKAQRDKARWNMATRYFFGADVKQIAYLKKKMEKL